MRRVHNFNAGPSALPLAVLEEIRADIPDWNGTGMSILEVSHRSKDFQNLLEETKALLRSLLRLTENQAIVFIQGGGSMQFLMEAANFLKHRAAYIDTGVWAGKARDAATFFGESYDAASGKKENYAAIPDTFSLLPDTDYLHITSNNTIYGTEWQTFPETDVPLVCDMSSDILSREIDGDRFSLLWAGLQKNLGIAGCALAVLRPDFLETAREDIPTFLQYKTFVKHDSAYNTPPVFCIYVLYKILRWIESEGGVAAIEARNIRKAAMIYDVIDESGGFYRGHAQKDCRSRMNVTFRLASPDAEADFIARAKAENLIGTGGHRLVGGCRVSLYNAVTEEDAAAMASFMKEYQRIHG